MDATSALEQLISEALDEGAVTEVMRPAAVLPEQAARSINVELTLADVRAGGVWQATTSEWNRFDRPFDGPDGTPGTSRLLGTMQIAHGTPTRYQITIYRATVTRYGTEQGFTVESLCDDALRHGDLDLSVCPRADLRPPPKPFRF